MHRPFGLFAAALALAAAALALPAGSQSRPPRSDAPAAGVTGSVVGYQESAGSAILYHEEKGGMVTQVPPPVPRAAGKAPANAPATKAAANGGSKAAAKGGTKAPAPVASKLAQQ